MQDNKVVGCVSLSSKDSCRTRGYKAINEGVDYLSSGLRVKRNIRMLELCESKCRVSMTPNCGLFFTILGLCIQAGENVDISNRIRV
jgi:hypothetical protein